MKPPEAMAPADTAALSRLGDAERLTLARGGDQHAWVEIVSEFGPKVKGYARGKGIADADDVVQDVFLAAAERLGEFEGDWRSFRSWIFSIAYRQIVNRYRSAGREGAELPVSLEDANPGPPELVVEAETVRAASQALDVLSGVERDVVLMRVLAGLDTDQVATAVGKSAGNVRVIQSRAMGKVRAELERMGYAKGREG